MARDFVDVARRISALLPPEHSGALESVIASAFYKAPEASGDLWRELNGTVNELVGPPPIEDGWRVSVVAALIDESEDDVRWRYCTPMTDGGST